MYAWHACKHTHTKPATLASWPHLPRTNPTTTNAHTQTHAHTHTHHLLPHLVESKLAPQPVRKPNKKPSLFRTPTPCAGAPSSINGTGAMALGPTEAKWRSKLSGAGANRSKRHWTMALGPSEAKWHWGQ